jgi:LuxR family maltose regulon positive regulatory protein
MLKRIEESNLFLVPLDAERQWYRYHALFSDALRNYLRREHPVEFVQGLHRRAAAWYAHHGFFPDALEHALAGQERLQGVQALLERLQRDAQAGGRKGQMIESIMLQALVYQAQGQTMQALMLLQQALALAEPEGYARLIDEGTAMDTLLSKLVEMQRQRKLSLQDQFSWVYVKRLLKELGQGKRHSSDQSRGDVSHSEAEQGMIQPLSKREVDILCRIAQGLSNQAIADEMVIELSTVKSHLKHIYRKLNVDSRTQAVALARKLDLL